MHTLQSAKDLLYSLPIDVQFAGFRGNTLSLAKAGWDLSMKQGMDFGQFTMQLAMRSGNRDCAIYALSNVIRLPYGDIGNAIHSTPMGYAKFLTSICFEIAYVANDIRFQVIPQMASRGISFSSEFNAIDAMPQMRTKEESIQDFKFFKMANPESQELIITPDRVPEILDLILKAQSKDQAEIRERMKSRENLRQYKNGDMFDAKPDRNICAQLITLAG